MINWNDIRVEQEIAQERYQQLIQARQVAQVRRENAGQEHRTPYSTRFRNRVGEMLVTLGCRVQRRPCQGTVTQ